MLSTLRNRLHDEEKGFTLVELLVVILIIGILAAIAIPSFLSQTDKAADAQAKSAARNAQTAAETYNVDNNGTYTAMTPAKLQAIEPALADANIGGTLAAAPDGTNKGYTLSVTNTKTGNQFNVIRDPVTGVVTRTCTVSAKGGCPTSGTW